MASTVRAGVPTPAITGSGLPPASSARSRSATIQMAEGSRPAASIPCDQGVDAVPGHGGVGDQELSGRHRWQVRRSGAGALDAAQRTPEELGRARDEARLRIDRAPGVEDARHPPCRRAARRGGPARPPAGRTARHAGRPACRRRSRRTRHAPARPPERHRQREAQERQPPAKRTASPGIAAGEERHPGIEAVEAHHEVPTRPPRPDRAAPCRPARRHRPRSRRAGWWRIGEGEPERYPGSGQLDRADRHTILHARRAGPARPGAPIRPASPRARAPSARRSTGGRDSRRSCPAG